MRKRIQDLAYARFRHGKPILQFSVERLEFEVLQEELYRGSFSMTSVNGIPMRGFVYSSHPRMKCTSPEFSGTEVDISFEFHSDGLVEGDIQKGDFTIILNGGEYNLSFVASISRFYAVSTIGKIKNLFDFANLAQVSFAEAYRIFTAPFFENILKETEERERLLYRGIGGQKATMQGLEEFLIGIRKKHRVHVEMEETSKRLFLAAEDVKESVSIKKDCWGYLELLISSDHEAVVPQKARLTTEDFVGNHGEVSFLVRTQMLHEGNNYARLTVRGLDQSCFCELCIRRELPGQEEKGSGNGRDGSGREQKKLVWRLARLYLDYRMQRIVTGVWSKESCGCLERLRELEPKNRWYLLYHAQVLLINKQKQEAKWLMDAFFSEPEPKDTPLYAFYLYLCTLQEREPSNIGKIFQQIQEIYQKNQEDMRLFLIMLFLDPHLNQSRSRKLAAIEEKVDAGIYSPLLYMEAYYLIQHDVYLLQKLGGFQRRVLYWAHREGAITSEVGEQVIRLISQLRQYHPAWYQILEGCCRKRTEPEALQAMCSFGIRWNLQGEGQFAWYDKGIRDGFKIAGLYEAWLECAGRRKIEQFPKNVMLYFQYQNSLSDQKKAQLYANIVRDKAKQKNVYQSYKKQIQDFAVMQMQNRQIDENLAILYEAEWKKLMAAAKMWEALADILYVHKFICQDPRAVRVVVIHRELEKEQIVPLIRQQAYIQIYSGSHCILVEDERGVRYVPEESWELKRLMQPGRCIRQCVEEAPLAYAHLIHYFDSRKTYHTLQEEDLPRLVSLLEAEGITEEYRWDRKPQIIEYYYQSSTGEKLDDYLKQIDCSGLRRGIRNKLVELMIARGIYEPAYEMLKDYGSEQVAVSRLLMIAGQKIQEAGCEEEEKLTGLCMDIFRRGKYNEAVLRYLCRYFLGSIRELERLWLAAKEFEVDTFELEERFLVQLLFTESYTEHMEKVFQSYYRALGQEMVVMAYLSYFSYQYFVQGMPISDGLFQCLGHQFELENPLNEICRLAQFRWLAQQRVLTAGQERQLEGFLKENLKRHRYFAFYQQLPQWLLVKYQLHDRMFLEYRSHSARRVLIDYCCTSPLEEPDYVEEDMEQVYEGIFVKQFVVFFGEEIPYYIKEESPNQQMITESGHIKPEDVAQGDESYYDLLNGMMVSYHMKDQRTLTQLYGQYLKRQQQAEEWFWPL